MILIVAEDDKFCQRFIVEALEKLCENIITVTALRDLWTKLGDTVDAIWLDLTLADCTAEQMIEAIPEIRRQSPHATLLVVSGHGNMYRDQALSAGADEYAGKDELGGFNQRIMGELLQQAALGAMRRGVDAHTVLEVVAQNLSRLSNLPAVA